MSSQSSLDRLANARPQIAARPEAVVGPEERESLLSQITTSPDPLPSQRPERSRRSGFRVVVVAGVAVLAVVAVLLGVLPGSHRTTVQPRLAYVLDRATTAIQDAKESVVYMHEIEYGPTPNDETISNEWFDQNSMTHYRMEALNASLQPLLDLGVFEESGMHLTEVVEYSTRSWSIGPATRTELGESTDAAWARQHTLEPVTDQDRSGASSWAVAPQGPGSH